MENKKINHVQAPPKSIVLIYQTPNCMECPVDVLSELSEGDVIGEEEGKVALKPHAGAGPVGSVETCDLIHTVVDNF